MDSLFFLPIVRHIYTHIAQEETRDVYIIMFSGRGYCTQPTCFPVLGAPPILVFLCKTHCRHMLCYRHWLSHQTSKTIMLNDEQQMNYSSSNSDRDEQENFPDLLKECTNQEEYQHKIIDSNEDKKMIKPQIYKKEIEWWNEITSWKNSENFNMKITEESNDEDIDYIEDMNKNDDSVDSDYHTKRKRKTYKKNLERSITCRSYSDECPLTFDGAFGLIQAYHQHQLCSPSKNSNKKICLYQHFNSKHGFTREVSARLVRAMIHQENPSKIKLFSSTIDIPSTLFDPFHKVKCPLSIRDDILNTPCLTEEITRKSIRRHLSGVHRLDNQTINKLIKEMIK